MRSPFRSICLKGFEPPAERPKSSSYLNRTGAEIALGGKEGPSGAGAPADAAAVLSASSAAPAWAGSLIDQRILGTWVIRDR